MSSFIKSTAYYADYYLNPRGYLKTSSENENSQNEAIITPVVVTSSNTQMGTRRVTIPTNTNQTNADPMDTHEETGYHRRTPSSGENCCRVCAETACLVACLGITALASAAAFAGSVACASHEHRILKQTDLSTAERTGAEALQGICIVTAVISACVFLSTGCFACFCNNH